MKVWHSILLVGAAFALASCASAPAGGAASRTSPPAEVVDPKDPLAAMRLLQQGQLYLAENKVAEAIDRFRTALKLQPKNPTIHNVLGVAELQRGDATRALEAFNQSLALAPSYADARNNRGTAYMRLGQAAMAEADYLSVLADPTYANRAGVYFNLGSLYLSRGNLQGAQENLRRSTVAAGSVEAYVLLGRVEERLGRLEAAETAYRDAATRAPERADVLLTLAEFLDAHGKADQARGLYRQVVQLAPGTAEAELARTKLGS